LYSRNRKCVIQYDIVDLVNLLILDIYSDKTEFRYWIIESIDYDSMYCLQHLLESYGYIYCYNFSTTFIQDILYAIDKKKSSPDFIKKYIDIFSNFIPDFNLHVLIHNIDWKKYLNIDILYKPTTEKCIVSYDIPLSFYKLCTSNVPHTVTLDVYMKLKNKTCPYCRLNYTTTVYTAIQNDIT
jgi:hypothetical protein